MYLVEGRNPKETRGQYVLTKEAAYAILKEMKKDFQKVNIYEKINGEYRRIKKWERLLSNREWVNSLSDDEFSEWLADVVSKQNKNRMDWYWWLGEKHSEVKQPYITGGTK